MNAMCRPCLYVVVVIGCGSFEVAEEKPSPKRSEYDEFIKYHTGKVEPEWFPGPKGSVDGAVVPLKLIVTAFEGDQPPVINGLQNLSESGRGFRVAADGQVEYFRRDGMGEKGGWGSTIPDADLKRLDKLLLKLPDDGARLPPPGRYLVLQVPEGNHCRARVYDRANAPDEVWEILHLSRSGIGQWVPAFKSESDLEVGDVREPITSGQGAHVPRAVFQSARVGSSRSDATVVDSSGRRHPASLLHDRVVPRVSEPPASTSRRQFLLDRPSRPRLLRQPEAGLPVPEHARLVADQESAG